MSNKRRRGKRRPQKRNANGSADWTLRDAIDQILAGGHPLDLLSMASVAINVARPESLLSTRCDPDLLDRFLGGLIGVRNRETTVLLAVIAELLVAEPALQLRCRRELAERGENLPRLVTALQQTDIYRAVRRTNVFGDVEEIVLGMRFDGGHELTIAVLIDHNMWSSVTDAVAVQEPIDEALARVAESSSDTEVSEMTLADARVWIEDALNEPTLSPETVTWPLYHALVEWSVSRLPEGGEHRPPVGEWKSYKELCDKFFATTSAAPFTEHSHRNLLLELFDSGNCDPSRWSPARVEHAIGGAYYIDDFIPVEIALDAPDLLRAFIPYVHAQSGIREELTSRTLAMVDTLRSSYKREVLRAAQYWGLDDAV